MGGGGSLQTAYANPAAGGPTWRSHVTGTASTTSWCNGVSGVERCLNKTGRLLFGVVPSIGQSGLIIAFLGVLGGIPFLGNNQSQTPGGEGGVSVPPEGQDHYQCVVSPCRRRLHG